MGLLDLLQQVAGGQAEAHFDELVRQAPANQLGAGLAAALRSDQTPPFGELVGKLFGMSSSAQQAGILNQLIGVLGPTVLSTAAGGVLGRLLAPGQSQVTPEQASRLTPVQVTEIASHAEVAQPAIVDQVAQFYAQHAGLIKTLGGAALTVALAKMKENAAKA